MKKYLITGGAGSLGKALVKKLSENKENQIYVYSRDEGKHALSFGHDPNVTCFVGDIRDYDRLNHVFGIVKPDYVIHAAALKSIDDMELNPTECIKTNTNGSENVAKVSLQHKVSKCILVSTDKACEPVNVYGSSKFIAERIFTNYDYYSDHTIFSSVRYGNVIASRGSFIPLWMDLINSNKKLKVTSTEMTRFLFTLSDAVDVVLNSLHLSEGGEVFIPKIKSYTLPSCINALGQLLQKTPEYDIIGLRPGEKLHEDMLGESELPFTYKIKTSNIDLLQVRPQYTKRIFTERPAYKGLHFNSSLHVSENVNDLLTLIKKGLLNTVDGV